MNEKCTICGKPVDEHIAGRETDFCIAKREGWKFVQNAYEETGYDYFCRGENFDDKIRDGGWWLVPDSDPIKGWACAKCGDNAPPEYTSPDSIDPAWGLVEKIKGFTQLERTLDPLIKARWMVIAYRKDEWQTSSYAPTPQLCICRAYLAKEEEG